MALYSGKNNYTLDLIAKLGISEEEIKEIADKLISPIPGEIRFVTEFTNLTANGLTSIGGINRLTNDKICNGWVYPDGSYYQCNQFPEISAEYVKNNNLFFQVPNLIDFHKPSINFNNNYSTDKIPNNNQVIKHRHRISYNGNIGTTIRIKNGFRIVATTSYATQNYYSRADIGQEVYPEKDTKGHLYTSVNKPPDGHDLLCGFHNGSSSSIGKNEKPIPMYGRLKMSETGVLFDGVETSDCGLEVNNAIFQPEAINIPTMIYLGKPNYNTTVEDITLVKITIKSAKYYNYNVTTKKHELDQTKTTHNILNKFYIQSGTKIDKSTLITPVIVDNEYQFEKYSDEINNEITDNTDIYIELYQKTYNLTFKYCSKTISVYDTNLSVITVPYGYDEKNINKPDIQECPNLHGYTLKDWYTNNSGPVYENRTYLCQYQPVPVEIEIKQQDESENDFNSNDVGSITINGINSNGYASYNSSLQFIIENVNPFYIFKYWKINNEIQSTNFQIGYHVRTINKITITAVYKRINIVDVKLYLPYRISDRYEMSDDDKYSGTITTTNGRISLTASNWKSILSNKGITASNYTYFKFIWNSAGQTVINYLDNINSTIKCDFNKDTHPKNTEYTLKINCYKLIASVESTEVAQYDYGIKYDLNENGCSASLTRLKTNANDYNDPKTTSNKTKKYKKCYAKIKYDNDQDTETIVLGIIRNESNSGNAYFYNIQQKNLSAYTFNKQYYNFIPVGNYKIYRDESCTYYTETLDIGISVKTLTNDQKDYNIYPSNPVWIPLDSEYDVQDKIGLYIQAYWEEN